MKRALRFVPAILWWLLTLYLFTLPGSAFPKADWLDTIQADKWIHIFLFAVLVFLFLLPFKKQWLQADAWRMLLLIPVSALAYGIIIEFVQLYFVPNRSFDVGDIAADAIGCLLPLWWIRWHRKRKG